MSNERLRSAIIAAGLTLNDVSERVSVDPKTVERWISQARVPHRTHRLKVAAMLQADDAFLWPTTKSDPHSIAASRAELLDFYPSRGAVPAELWTSMIEGASDSVDLLAFAGSFLHDSLPGFVEALAAKAERGVRVRLLFGDPESAAVNLRGAEEGLDDGVAARCRMTWSYLAPVLKVSGVQSRQHGATLYNSLFRFDSDVLANVHTFGAAASQSPVLHLRRIPGGRLFDHYMTGFERTWDGASPLPV